MRTEICFCIEPRPEFLSTCPCHPSVHVLLKNLPSENPRYFFWSGNGESGDLQAWMDPGACPALQAGQHSRAGRLAEALAFSCVSRHVCGRVTSCGVHH